MTKAENFEPGREQDGLKFYWSNENEDELIKTDFGRPAQLFACAIYGASRLLHARHWRFVLLARSASSQFDDDQNRFPLDAFIQMDAYVSRQLHRGAEVFAAVESMTGSRVVIARTPLVNVGPPTAVRVGIRFSVQ